MAQHTLSQEQLNCGLYNPQMTEDEAKSIKSLMMVDPKLESLKDKATQLWSIIKSVCDREGVKQFHIMGQGNLMLCLYLVKDKDYDMLESTTERKSIDVVNADGTTTKTNVFEFVQLRKYGF